MLTHKTRRPEWVAAAPVSEQGLCRSGVDVTLCAVAARIGQPYQLDTADVFFETGILGCTLVSPLFNNACRYSA